MTDDPTPPTPLLTIVRGLPADADGAVEIAVLTAVLTTRRGGPETAAAAPTGWAARETLVRRPLTPGPHGWYASRLPR